MFVKNIPISCPELINSVRLGGAVSLPLIEREVLPDLLGEARLLAFEQLPETVGRVKQQLSFCRVDDQESIFWQLAMELQNQLRRFLPRWAFRSTLAFNEIEVLRYPANSSGISVHRDSNRYVNLIALVNITGGGQFFTCADRNGSLSIAHAATAGDVILMPGPGFDGLEAGPFHYVDGIVEERFVCSIRQKMGKS